MLYECPECGETCREVYWNQWTVDNLDCSSYDAIVHIEDIKNEMYKDAIFVCPECLQQIKGEDIIHVHEVSVDTWFERDRANVAVYVDSEVCVQWWDEDVYEAVQDGFLNGKDWKESAIKYCSENGLLPDIFVVVPA